MSKHPGRRRPTGRALIATVAIVALLAASLYASGSRDASAVATPTAQTKTAQQPDNWNFERGTLSGWHTRSSSSGAWYAYADGSTPPDPAQTDPHVAFDVPDPPEGRYAAVTDMTAPGTRILYRDFKLDGPTKLTFTVFYDNAGPFASPAALDFRGCEPNQQFRVELLDAAAPADTTAAKHVLATIFQTDPGDPPRLAPRTVTFDLSRWDGERVRLRFAQVDNSGPLRAGVDDVQLVAVDR